MGLCCAVRVELSTVPQICARDGIHRYCGDHLVCGRLQQLTASARKARKSPRATEAFFVSGPPDYPNKASFLFLELLREEISGPVFPLNHHNFSRNIKGLFSIGHMAVRTLPPQPASAVSPNSGDRHDPDEIELRRPASRPTFRV